MTYNTTMMAPDADPTVRRFLKALARQEFEDLEACLAPDVWFRALLPKSLHESGTGREAAEAYRSWYGTVHRLEPLVAEQFRMAGREYLRYRFRALPPWAPREWHVIEQAGFCRVKDGRISRLDVVCTGFHPAAAPAGVRLFNARALDHERTARPPVVELG